MSFLPAIGNLTADALKPSNSLGTLNTEIKMTAGIMEFAPDAIAVGQMRIHYLIDGTATGGMGVFELSVPPHSDVPPPNSHTRNEECVYVLEGTLRYSVDGKERKIDDQAAWPHDKH